MSRTFKWFLVANSAMLLYVVVSFLAIDCWNNCILVMLSRQPFDFHAAAWVVVLWFLAPTPIVFLIGLKDYLVKDVI